MPMSAHIIGYKQMWWETFTKVFLSNMINYGESDVQWQISI